MTRCIIGMGTKPAEDFTMKNGAVHPSFTSWGGTRIARSKSSLDVFPRYLSVRRLHLREAERISGVAEHAWMAGCMVGASVTGVTLIGIPVAISKGNIRSTRMHLGAEVRVRRSATDAKSGAVVASKALVWGFGRPTEY
jgi:hypothetical protein